MTRGPAAALLVLGLWVSACGAQPESTGSAGSLTLDPLMSRGPANAPVTIVEFSDYQ